MIAPLLRSMVCPPNFSVLRREGSRRDFDAFGRSRPSCEGTTTAGGAPGSGENGGSRCERGPPLEIPPNGLRREPLRMYFYTRADNQASTLELLSKITSCSPVLATFSIHTTPCVSRHPPVVVMQAIEDWECHDTTVSLGHSRQRLFLPEALVWPRLVVEAGVLRDEAQKMALAKHEDMVEQFAPESADKALGEGVHVRGPDRGANESASRSVSAFGSEVVTAIATEGGSPPGATEAQWPAAPASTSSATKPCISSGARSSSAASP